MISQPIHVNTDNTRIYNVVGNLINGNWRIPQFQRDYCWTKKNVEDLIDSASRGWPLGNMFMVEVRHDSFLRDVPVKDKFTNNPITESTYELIIDGAQRSETLYKLLGSMEFCWLYDVRTGKSSVETTEMGNAICEADPFMFNNSRYMSPYYIFDSGWNRSMKMRDLSPLATEWSEEEFGPYMGAFKKRLLESLLSPGEQRMFDLLAQAGYRPAPSLREPQRWSKELEAKMTRQQHTELRETYKEHLRSVEVKRKEWDRLYSDLEGQTSHIRSNYLAAYKDAFDHIKTLDDAYIGTTILRLDRRSGMKPKDLVEYFRRYNMSGVPVDVDFLDKLAATVETL